MGTSLSNRDGLIPRMSSLDTRRSRSLGMLLASSRSCALPPPLRRCSARLRIDLTLPSDKTGIVWAEGVGLVKNLQIPIRDGVRLAADLYVPDDKDWEHQRRPAVVEYRPYRKDDELVPEARFYERLVRHGYLVERVDIRGTGASEGFERSPPTGVQRRWQDGRGLCHKRHDARSCGNPALSSSTKKATLRLERDTERDKPTSSFGTSFLRSGKCPRAMSRSRTTRRRRRPCPVQARRRYRHNRHARPGRSS
jgi:hypothetical protein